MLYIHDNQYDISSIHSQTYWSICNISVRWYCTSSTCMHHYFCSHSCKMKIIELYDICIEAFQYSIPQIILQHLTSMPNTRIIEKYFTNNKIFFSYDNYILYVMWTWWTHCQFPLRLHRTYGIHSCAFFMSKEVTKWLCTLSTL